MSRPKKGTAISLVVNQDVTLAESGQLMTITLFSPIENSTRHVTDVCVAVDVCLKSPYLKSRIDVSKVRLAPTSRPMFGYFAFPTDSANQGSYGRHRHRHWLDR